MKFLYSFIFLITSILNVSANDPDTNKVARPAGGAAGVTLYPQEKHLKNVKQLTFGGDNAEAYFSFDNKKITFQAHNKAWGDSCDQIYTVDLMHSQMDRMKPQQISTGMGRTTCSYFMPGDSTIIYASTHLANKACPVVPPRRTDGKYVWSIYDSF